MASRSVCKIDRGTGRDRKNLGETFLSDFAKLQDRGASTPVIIPTVMAQLPYARFYPPKLSKTDHQTSRLLPISIPPAGEVGATFDEVGNETHGTKKRKRGQHEPAEVFFEPRKLENLGAESTQAFQFKQDKKKKRALREDSNQVQQNGVKASTLFRNDSEANTPIREAVDAYGSKKSHRDKERKPKKTVKKESSTAPTNEPNDSAEQQEEQRRLNKHASIFEKYKKSAQKADAVAADGRAEQPNPLSNAQPKHGLEPIPQPHRVPEAKFRATYATLPSWLAAPIIVPSTTSLAFSETTLSLLLRENLSKRGYHDAFAVQAALLPLLLPGLHTYDGDLCVSAATGSGKTFAYILPMIDDLRGKAVTKLRGLIVVPTRELVNQVREALEVCAAGTHLRVGTAVGSKVKAEERDMLVRKRQIWDPDKAAFLRARFEQTLHFDYDKHNALLQGETLLPDHVPEYISAVDILVCTPGRLVDHIRHTEGFSLHDLRWLVIDEADRLLDQSFQEWVEELLHSMEKKDSARARDKILSTMWNFEEPAQLRKVILSATMTRDLSKLASLKLRKPTLVAVLDTDGSLEESLEMEDASKGFDAAIALPPGITEWAVPAGDGSEKPLLILALLRSHLLSPEPSRGKIDHIGATRASEQTCDVETQESDGIVPRAKVLIFTRSDEDATRLSYILRKLEASFGTRLSTLTKSSSIRDQRKALNAFHRGEANILVASDRVSRGIDVKDVAHVVNYDPPNSMTSYIHRAGRTARAGAVGEAWTFVMDHEARWFWNEIARNRGIGRHGRKVERLRVEIGRLGETIRQDYEEALDGMQSVVLGRN